MQVGEFMLRAMPITVFLHDVSQHLAVFRFHLGCTAILASAMSVQAALSVLQCPSKSVFRSSAGGRRSFW